MEDARPFIALLSGLCVAAVWIFHGLYSKLLNGLPRHRLIVARVLGERHAGSLTRVIGALEVLLGLWVVAGRAPIACAAVQTMGLLAMNTLEIFHAHDLLFSAWEWSH